MEREDSSERLRRLLRVTDVALAHLSPEALLDELLIRVREVLEADTAAVLLLDVSGGELIATAAKGLEEEVEAGVRIPVGMGFAGTIAAERKPRVIERVDHRNVMNPILREKGVRSLLGVPLIVSGDVLGVLHVGSLVERRFTEQDVELLQLVAERVALALHVRLYERERVLTETLQRTFLPEALPSVPGLRIASRYLAASAAAVVGGDWYDVFVLSSGGIALAMGDVAGHGIVAASVMARIRNALRAYTMEVDEPAEVVGRLDRLMRLLDAPDIVTLLFGILDEDLSTFRFVSAGHVPPVLVSHDGPRLLEAEHANPPLGTGRAHEFAQEEVSLAGGDSLLFYTDGLVERRDESLSDGLARLCAQASFLTMRDPHEAIASILPSLIDDSGPADDIAVLLVQLEEVRPTIDVRIPSDPTELATARRAMRRWLSALGVPDDVGSDVLTAVGEACANAVEHAYGPAGGWVSVHGSREDGMIRVTVRDSGTWRTRRSRRGHGMTLMRELMDTVEIDRSATGTSVTLLRNGSGA